MLRAGIYWIRNTVNGKCYVGSAVSFRRRKYEHYSYLRRGKHHCQHLQHAWDKYGEEAFVLEPLLVCGKDQLLFYEQRAIDSIHPEYNAARVAGNTLGVRLSADVCARMSDYRKGRKQAPEHVAARATANRGKKRTEATKEKIRSAAAKRKHTAETIEKLRAISTGKRLSAETRAKISAGVKGKPCGPRGPLPAERKEAISAALKAFYAAKRVGMAV